MICDAIICDLRLGDLRLRAITNHQCTQIANDGQAIGGSGAVVSRHARRVAARGRRAPRAAGGDETSRCPRAIIAPHAGLHVLGSGGGVGLRARAASAATPPSCSSARRISSASTACRSGRGARGRRRSGRSRSPSSSPRRLRPSPPESSSIPQAHGREHSLEMQLPFVARLLPGVPIVPLVMGHQTRETAMALGDALATRRGVAARDGRRRRAARGQQRSVALRGCGDRGAARRRGAAARRGARRRRPDGRARARAAACVRRRTDGVGAARGVARSARRRARVLRYADSGDVSGDKSSVVGYMAAAIW